MNILVTGGSSGLGRSIVENLSVDVSNNVFFTFNKHSLAAKEIAVKYHNTNPIHCDFNDKKSLEFFLSEIKRMNIDVLINNAYSGTSDGKHFHKILREEFLLNFCANVLPTIAITQEVLTHMRLNHSGKIITILSAFLLNSPPIGYSLYSAGKAYLWQLSKSWSKEYIKFGITSNCVSPNFMVTEFTKNTDERLIEQLTNGHPLKKLLSTEEVAECVRFLVYSSKQVNGVNIPINAGDNIL